MITQKETILRHIREHGKITALEAAIKYKITRLSARVYDLRQDGYNIQNRHIRKKGKRPYDEFFIPQEKS